MFRRIYLIIIFLVQAGPASAGVIQNCMGPSSDESIKACTVAIKANRWNEDLLAKLFYSRGKALKRKAEIILDRRQGWRGVVLNFVPNDDWGSVLSRIPVMQDIAPWRLAIVLRVDRTGALIGLRPNRLKDGKVEKRLERGVIPFAEMKWARKALGNSGLGPKLKGSDDVLKRGDVIYAAPSKAGGNVWQLMQMPKSSSVIHHSLRPSRKSFPLDDNYKNVKDYLELSIDDFSNAIKYNDALAEAYNLRGRVLKILGQSERANMDLKYAAQLWSGSTKSKQYFSISPGSSSRIALVIGNSEYAHTGHLLNPDNDTEDIADALRQLGFEVVLERNLAIRRFEAVIADFSNRLHGAEVALFWYAGHGMQYQNESFLMPVDSRLENESDIRKETISIENIISQMGEQAKINLLFLDSCRDNPLANSLNRRMLSRGRSGRITRGMADIPIRDSQSLIVYAAAPGEIAEDGHNQRNSPFTAAVLKHIMTPNLEISTMMKRVRREVKRITNGRQAPESLTRLEEEFRFLDRKKKTEARREHKHSQKPTIGLTPDTISLGKSNMLPKRVARLSGVSDHQGGGRSLPPVPQRKPRPSTLAKLGKTWMAPSDYKHKFGSTPRVIDVDKVRDSEVITLSIEKGDTIYGVLTRAGINKDYAYDIARKMTRVFPVSELRQGHVIRMTMAAPGANGVLRPEWIILDTNERQVALRLTKEDAYELIHPSEIAAAASSANYGKKQKVTVKRIGESKAYDLAYFTPQKTETYHRSRARIRSSFYASAINQNIPRRIVNKMAAILYYGMDDFQKEVARGEVFEVFYANEGKDEGVLYTEMNAMGKKYAYYRFKTASGVTGYFDENGNSARKSLMRRPVNGARMASHLTPQIPGMRPGVDYYAPSGTPVYAAADGNIIKAGLEGDYGNFVLINHSEKFETAYAHLSRISRGIKPGKQVGQGQIIGYVGSTGHAGLPHLHYELRVSGKAVDLLSYKRAEKPEKLSSRELVAFNQERQRIDSLRKSTAITTFVK